MPGGRQLNDVEKAQIEVLREAGYSIQRIGEVLGRSRSVVARYLSDPEGYGTRLASGRKLQIDDKTITKIVQRLRKEIMTPAQIIEAFQLNVSTATVKRAIKRKLDEAEKK